MKMSGRTVLVTGGTSGIGFALAERLLRRGNTVIVTGRTSERLEEARAKLPGVHVRVCDQADREAVARLCVEATRDFPALDGLINNAGVGLKRKLGDVSVPAADLEREIRTNLTGPIQLVHGLLPHLRGREEALIVNVSSGLAFVPLALKPIYSATKAAMHAYTQSLRAQLANTSVRVVELAPPATRTAFNDAQPEMNAGPQMTAEAVADAAIHGLEQGREEILPGLSKALRLTSRLRPGAVLRAAEAAKMNG